MPLPLGIPSPLAGNAVDFGSPPWARRQRHAWLTTMKGAYMAVPASSGPILCRRSVPPPADAPGQAQSRGAAAGECSKLAGQRSTADLPAADSGHRGSARYWARQATPLRFQAGGLGVEVALLREIG